METGNICQNETMDQNNPLLYDQSYKPQAG